jgi:isoquinoline 1-oxidoreductase alpha subunit
MAAAALLKNYPNPSETQIDEAMTNICRCGTYQRIREAIHTAVQMSSKKIQAIASMGDSK